MIQLTPRERGPKAQDQMAHSTRAKTSLPLESWLPLLLPANAE